MLTINRDNLVHRKGFLETPVKLNHNITAGKGEANRKTMLHRIRNDAITNFRLAASAYGVHEGVETLAVIGDDPVGKILLLLGESVMEIKGNLFGDRRKLLCLRADERDTFAAIDLALVDSEESRVSISASRADVALFFPHNIEIVEKDKKVPKTCLKNQKSPAN